MQIARSTTAKLLLKGFAVLLSTGAANAVDKRAPIPDAVLEREHRLRVEQGERASRAIPPSPRPAVAPNNGIEQIPIDPRRSSGVFKEDGKQLDAETLEAASAPPCPHSPGMKTASLVKAFPEVTWHVCVRDMGLKSLWVGPVYLKRTHSGPWMAVLHQAGLAEIFVPYHHTNNRPYDLRWTAQLDQVRAQDAGMNGSLITLTGETVPTVVAEVRDRGVGWLCKQDTSATRRAQEFLIWGVADAGNYDNILQYGFRDDGGMTFRMGNTGYNLPGAPAEAHTHNGLWRVDLDLHGGRNDSAYSLLHKEPSSSPLQAQDIRVPFKVEGGRRWNTPEFVSLLVEDASTNAFGHKLGYEFTPAQAGAFRHYGPKESWTRNDVYVTVYQPGELGWTTQWAPPDDYLLAHLNGEPAINKDLIIWIKASAHHDPIDEDKSVQDRGGGGPTGVTLTHWSGFNVEPHNLFNANPLGGPVRCGG
jgi:primary-amine oxidase